MNLSSLLRGGGETLNKKIPHSSNKTADVHCKAQGDIYLAISSFFGGLMFFPEI